MWVLFKPKHQIMVYHGNTPNDGVVNLTFTNTDEIKIHSSEHK